MLIGIGHKARHGKDTLASLLNIMLQPAKIKILSWADALKDEISDKGDGVPLIFSESDDTHTYYSIFDKYLIGTKARYLLFRDDEVPYLHKIFTARGINIYFGQPPGTKDSEMLQFWGTDYRRKQDPDYWVKKLLEQVADNTYDYILIPDTRFKNEYNAVDLYIDVKRIEEGTTLYVDPSRSPTHPSETELDNVDADYTIIAKSNDLINFSEQALQIAKNLKAR